MFTKKTFFLLLALTMLCMPVFAQDGAAAKPAPGLITPAFAMAIASAGCAIGQGKAIASAAEGMGRNPGAAPAIRGALILGLVLIESLALYTLVVIFV